MGSGPFVSKQGELHETCNRGVIGLRMCRWSSGAVPCRSEEIGSPAILGTVAGGHDMGRRVAGGNHAGGTDRCLSPYGAFLFRPESRQKFCEIVGRRSLQARARHSHRQRRFHPGHRQLG